MPVAAAEIFKELQPQRVLAVVVRLILAVVVVPELMEVLV
jgi:hypothetical protein